MKDFLIALAPSLGVLLIFFIGIKALIEADRRERTAQARLEAAQDAPQARDTNTPRDPSGAGDPDAGTRAAADAADAERADPA